MPEVFPGSLVEYETHFEEPQGASQIFGKPDVDLPVSLAVGESEHAALVLDGCALPDGCTESLAPVREFGAHGSGLACLPGGLAGFVEPLLSGVYRMGVQTGFVLEEIADLLRCTRRDPDSLLAVRAPVIDANPRIDPPGFPVERVAYGFWKSARENVSTDHCASPAFLILTC